MEYVEILRARRVLTWYCGVLLAVLVIAVVSLYSGHAQLHGGEAQTSPLSALIEGCAFGAMIVATCVVAGLNAESSTLAITWTRPMPRATIAWRYIAVDVTAIVIAYVFTLAIVTAFFAAFGDLNQIAIDAHIGQALANGLGCALMWYGLVLLVTARLNGRGGLIAGLSWAAFLVLGALWAAPFPAVLHNLLTILNYVNPLTYYASHPYVSSRGARAIVLMLAPDILTLIAWGFVVVTFVASVRLWSTREV